MKEQDGGVLPLGERGYLHSIYLYYLDKINEFAEVIDSEDKAIKVRDYISQLPEADKKILYAMSETHAPDLLNSAKIFLKDEANGFITFLSLLQSGAKNNDNEMKEYVINKSSVSYIGGSSSDSLGEYE